MLGLAITVIIGGVIVVMIESTSQGTQNQADGRRQLVRIQALEAQLAGSLHRARAFLAPDATQTASANNYLVFWRGDTSRGNATNIAVDESEMCLLMLDSTNHQLKLYSFPLTYSQIDRTFQLAPPSYNPNLYWNNNALTEITSNAAFTPVVLANHVSSLNVWLDPGTPAPQAPLAAWKVSHCTCQVVLDLSLPAPGQAAPSGNGAGQQISAIFGLSIPSHVEPQ